MVRINLGYLRYFAACLILDLHKKKRKKKNQMYHLNNFTKLQLHDMVQHNHSTELLHIYQTQKKVKCNQQMKKQTLM